MITVIAVSPGGRYVATGQLGRNADINVWDYQTKQAIYTFEEHDKFIQALSFSDDEKILASVGGPEDNKLITWDLSNGAIIAANTKLPQGTTCVMFGGFVKDVKRRNTDCYQLSTAGKDGIIIWSLDPYTGDLIPTKIVGDARATVTRYVTAISFSDDFEVLYAATTSGDFLVTSVKAQKIIKTIQASKMGITAIVAYDDGIIVGCGDSTIKKFGSTFQFLGQVQLDGGVIGLSFSPDKLEILASTNYGTVVRMNLSTLKFMIISESHTKAVTAIAFPVGHSDRFATASLDGSVRVWDAAEYGLIATCHPRKEQDSDVKPLCLAFSDNILSGWSDGKVLAHNAETGENQWFIANAHSGGCTALCLSHNRRFIITGGPDGDVRLWELRSRELISHLKEHKSIITSLRLSNDDTIAISASRDRCILQWDLRLEKRIHCHMQRMGGINDVVLSADETYILSVGQEKRIVYWNTKAEQAVHSVALNGDTDEGKCIALSNDGKYVATAGTQSVIRIWDFSSGTLLTSASGQSGTIAGISFSPDDKQIVSVSDDGSIFIWCLFGTEMYK